MLPTDYLDSNMTKRLQKRPKLSTIQISTLADRLYSPSGFGTNLGVILDMFSKNCYIITMLFSGARQMVQELRVLVTYSISNTHMLTTVLNNSGS